MNNKEKFQELVDKVYPDMGNSWIYDAMNGWDSKFEQLGLTLVENGDEIIYDSYGYEDSTLERVYHHKGLDFYVKFSGIRCSYDGEEWNGWKIVTPKIKEITVYEEA